jgi:UDP:flavonoid glycosyltransferase YjiC (YdhE family)
LATPSKILIAPLDWGLGHTTRCIPIIRYLLAQGHTVYAAAEGASAKLLCENFSSLNVLHLDGYRIHYSRKRKLFTAKILLQVPKILSAIKKEHRWLEEQQEIHQFDLILSDNRYGLYHKQVKSIILTHQLQIMSGQGTFADGILRNMHYRMLNKFDLCWVVDEKQDDGYSGKLAHPKILPPNASYVGLLSQFSGVGATDASNVHNRILVLLSGPEPMRGQLEALILSQIKLLTEYTFTVVGGNPLGAAIKDLPAHVTYYTHLNAENLLPQLLQASLVICRSGYSTIMDLAVLSKKALLIPTPGQTEQEYLASYLAGQNYFLNCKQEDIDLDSQIPIALHNNVSPKPVTSNDFNALFCSVLKDK